MLYFYSRLYSILIIIYNQANKRFFLFFNCIFSTIKLILINPARLHVSQLKFHDFYNPCDRSQNERAVGIPVIEQLLVSALTTRQVDG